MMPQKLKGELMSEFQVGQVVELNGKEYKIIGTKARSYLLERDGKTYKATPDKMKKIQDQNQRPQITALQRRVKYGQLFDPTTKYPETETECQVWFDTLRCELSPENLCCDGEASRSQIAAKRRDISECWKELEKIVGRRVGE